MLIGFDRFPATYIVLTRGVPGCLLDTSFYNFDTLFYLSFTHKCIVSVMKQFGHPVFKFPAFWKPFYQILAETLDTCNYLKFIEMWCLYTFQGRQRQWPGARGDCLCEVNQAWNCVSIVSKFDSSIGQEDQNNTYWKCKWNDEIEEKTFQSCESKNSCWRSRQSGHKCTTENEQFNIKKMSLFFLSFYFYNSWW